jgi:hypothetical protein
METAMPQINVSEDTYARLKAFMPLAEYLNEGPVSLDEEGEVLILTGIQLLLRSLWERVEPGALVDSLAKLANRHPGEVSQFVADVLMAGGQKADEIKEEFGFARFRPKPK